MTSRNIIILIGILVVVIGLLADRYYLAPQESGEAIPAIVPPSLQPVAPVVSPTSPAQATSADPFASKTKTYRNEEWGFEFEYPNDWTFHENTFYSPFSRFNLVGASPEENNLPDPLAPSFLLNIVTPDFASRAFYDLRNVAVEISIGSLTGFEYAYEYEGLPKIAIVLPFGEYKIILGTYKIHEKIFNQILASFKFLK